MEKEKPKVLFLEEHGFWTRPESFVDGSVVWKKRGKGTMKYGRISIEPFPGEFREGASDWMLMEGIPLFITLENEVGRRLELLCQVDPEISIQRAFYTLVQCQKFFMYGPTWHARLSHAYYPAMLLTWLSDFELEVSIVPDCYIAGELPAESDLITSLLQKTGRDKLSPYHSYDRHKEGYDGFRSEESGWRRRPQWKYAPPQERLVRLAIIPEGLGTIVTAQQFFDALMNMWNQIVKRMGIDEAYISQFAELEKKVSTLRDPETDRRIAEHIKNQSKQPPSED